MNDERSARRQLLLTRIAIERVELLHDLAQARQSASVTRLLGLALAPTPLGALFGAGPPRAAAGSGWAGLALNLWQRWRRVAPVFGLVSGIAMPLLRKRRWLRRLLLGGGLAAGVWLVRSQVSQRLRVR